MLSTFDKYEIKTTFFVGGSWVAKNDAMLKEILARGHEIANQVLEVIMDHKEQMESNFKVD